MFQFPSWTTTLRNLSGIVVLTLPVYLIAVVAFGASPRSTDVGYQPTQPIPFSHALHAGELALDCRYCHNTVEQAGHAAVPPTATCLNCHLMVHTESLQLEPLRESIESGQPLEWVRVHDLPDYAYFNHAAHVNRGVGCVSCHGRIDKMEVVFQHEPLSMSWCIDCHREPEQHLRPLDQITNMTWAPENQLEVGHSVMEELGVAPRESCSTCHR